MLRWLGISLLTTAMIRLATMLISCCLATCVIIAVATDQPLSSKEESIAGGILFAMLFFFTLAVSVGYLALRHYALQGSKAALITGIVVTSLDGLVHFLVAGLCLLGMISEPDSPIVPCIMISLFGLITLGSCVQLLLNIAALNANAR